MPKLKSNPMIVINDAADNTNLELFVSSNLPTVQVKDGPIVSPSWDTHPLILSPSVYLNNKLLSNPSITWQRRSGGGKYSSVLLDGESVANNILTVNKNVLLNDENKIITYKCTVTYGTVTRTDEKTFTLNINASSTGSIAGDLTVNGVIKANKTDGSIVANSIDLGNRNNETGRGDGGYIDFHYEGSTLDYTSRIVENNYGVINIMSPNGLLINGASLADFVVQQGQSGSWMIRKWDSGIAECWRKISGTITDSGTWNNFRIFSGSADFPSNFFISSPNVQYCCYLGSGYAINARGVLSTTTKFNWTALGTDGDSNISYIVDCYAIGKWK